MTRLASLTRPATLIVVAGTLLILAPDGREAVAGSPFGCLACSGGQIVGCPSGSHKAWESSEDAVYSDGWPAHEECKLASCTTSHGHCEDQTEMLVAEIDEAMTRSDVAWLTRVLADRHDVVLNSERRAVQVTGCTGTLIASLPLTASLASHSASLAAAQ